MRHKKKLIKFARFGGLSPVVQKGYDPTMPSFHCPPARKGIYSFVYPYYVPFLLGSESYSGIKTKNSKFEYLKDKKGNKIEYGDDNYELYSEKNFIKVFTYTPDGYYHEEKDKWIKTTDKSYWIKPKKPKIFTYTGQIWHHLGENLKPCEYIKKKGNWWLSEYKDYEKAFNIEKHTLMSNTHKSIVNEWNGNLDLTIKTRDFGYYSKDHLEVFIERVK